VKLLNVKIIITTRVYLTHGPSGARPQAEWAQGLASRPNSLEGRLGFKAIRPKTWLTRFYMRRRSLSLWRKSVEAALLGRPATWLGRPAATTWHQTDFSKLVEVPFTPINTPPLGESRHTHHTLEIPHPKLSFLV
jgi:hypothetical protein